MRELSRKAGAVAALKLDPDSNTGKPEEVPDKRRGHVPRRAAAVMLKKQGKAHGEHYAEES